MEPFPALLPAWGGDPQKAFGEGPELGQGLGSSPATSQLWVILGKSPILSEVLRRKRGCDEK